MTGANPLVASAELALAKLAIRFDRTDSFFQDIQVNAVYAIGVA